MIVPIRKTTLMIAAAGLLCALASSVATKAAAVALPTGSPLDFGVLYYIPAEGDDSQIVSDLEKIKSHGYDHINLSAWPWLLPKPGSPLCRRAEFIVDWCDRNGLGVWLLENIQYAGSDDKSFDGVVGDSALMAGPLVADWVKILKGHQCVRGFILGNETGPCCPTDLSKAPRYRQLFIDWLRDQYPTIADLNRNWKTGYARFDQVETPAKSDPGWLDMLHFARHNFGRFYGQIFEALLKPALGANLGYATKTSDDPYLYREYPSATVLCWDDLVANYPLWMQRVLTDCDGRPAFNSEIHLYHDRYQFFSSIELTRYRYYMDVLTGERMSSSFAWGSWQKPEIAAIEAATPATLAEIRRLLPYLNAIASAQRTARVGVLVSEPAFLASCSLLSARPVLPIENKANSDLGTADLASQPPSPLEESYAVLSTTGRPWRFVLEMDIANQSALLDTLFVPGFPQMPKKTIELLLALPSHVSVRWSGVWPSEDEYGAALPNALVSALKKRCLYSDTLEQAASPLVDSALPAQARALADVPYDWWSSAKGHFKISIRYCAVEIRRAALPGNREVIALLNNTKQKRSLIPASLLPLRAKVTDLATDTPVARDNPLDLGPFDVRVLLVSTR